MPGYNRFSCPCLTNCGPVMREPNERKDIIARLGLPNGFQHTTVEKGIPVCDSLPMKHVKAVITHEMARDPNNGVQLFNQFMTKCTVLTLGGEVLSECDGVWFPATAVSDCLQKSQDNLVVDTLVRPIPEATNGIAIGKI